MADPKATPISALPKGPSSGNEDDQQFIQKILSQMNNDNQEAEQAYAQTQQNYNKHQFAVNQGEQHTMNQQQIAQAQAQAQYEQMGDDQYEQQYQYEEEVPMTFFERLKYEGKAPLMFLVLYFVLCFPFFRNTVAGQVAKFTQEKFTQLYVTTLVLGLIGGIAFYLINRFVV